MQDIMPVCLGAWLLSKNKGGRRWKESDGRRPSGWKTTTKNHTTHTYTRGPNAQYSPWAWRWSKRPGRTWFRLCFQTNKPPLPPFPPFFFPAPPFRHTTTQQPKQRRRPSRHDHPSTRHALQPREQPVPILRRRQRQQHRHQQQQHEFERQAGREHPLPDHALCHRHGLPNHAQPCASS